MAASPPPGKPRRLAQYVAWLDRVKYFILLAWVAILAVALSQVGRVFSRRAATLRLGVHPLPPHATAQPEAHGGPDTWRCSGGRTRRVHCAS